MLIDLSRCPKCNGPSDNGHDREVPPNPYYCTKCMAEPTTEDSSAVEPGQEPVADRAAFERHAERLGYSVDPDTREGREGGYWSSHTQLMWLTWQAALAEPAQEPGCRDDGMPTSAEERHLRRLLALRAAMPHAYYDDGEAQGIEHGISIDFMREPVAHIDAKLRALNVARAIAKQAEPVQDHFPDATKMVHEPVQEAEMRRCPRCWEPMFPPQPTPLTVERLRDALVSARIVPPAAVEDPDGYDDGVTLHRIEALHRRLA